MTISETYKQFPVNKGLQVHMVRVAAVAYVICESLCEKIDTQNVVAGCLVHDMGNLIKSKMDSFQEFFEPEGVVYWRGVKETLLQKYGTDVHAATIEMVKQINLNDQAYKYFLAIGSEVTNRVQESGSLGEKIATYSDMRVGPFGVLTLRERMDDIRRRYHDRNLPDFTPDFIDERERRLGLIEQDIFTHSTISPTDITDAAIADIQAELWHWEIT